MHLTLSNLSLRTCDLVYVRTYGSALCFNVVHALLYLPCSHVTHNHDLMFLFLLYICT